MKILYLLLFLISFSLSAKVQDSLPITKPQEVIYDLDSSRAFKQFDTEKIKEFKTDEDFDYTEYVEPDNVWTRFKNWFGQLVFKFLKSLLGIEEITGFWLFIFQILPYIIIIGVMFLLIWLFMKVNPSDMLFEKQQPPQVELTEDEDIIQNQDIEKLIQQAIQNSNYRLAIRYYYLFVLKKLSDQEFIIWESQKTNTDYIRELSDSSIKDQFTVITRLYNFIWYGSFDVDEKSYQQAEKEFKSITKTIKA